MNDGKGDGRCHNTENNDTLYFNQIPDEEKGCNVVGTAHTVSHARRMLYGTVSKTFVLLEKRRDCVFATNNHYR